MKYKPINDIDNIEDIKSEISLVELKLKNLPKTVVKEILSLTGIAIVFPFLYGKYGRRPMIENWEYENALIFIVLVFVVTYLVAHSRRKSKMHKRRRGLTLKKHLLEKGKV